MCVYHWRLAPADLQAAVYHHYRQGQSDDGRPSKRWIAAAKAVIAAVAVRERVQQRQLAFCFGREHHTGEAVTRGGRPATAGYPTGYPPNSLKRRGKS